ncbi:MAG TPA: hypothetical protein VF768_07000, partial [Holophagaceae bacterium]
RIRATVAAVVARPALGATAEARAEALRAAVAEALGDRQVDRWIGGSSGSARLDASEARLSRDLSRLPSAVFPKLVWGELAGVGGPLLAAGCLEPASRVLVTGPGSFGPQYAAVLEGVRL